jgi:hypothetical protein
MMSEDEEYPLEYRRYSAFSTSPPKPVNPESEESETAADATSATESDSFSIQDATTASQPPINVPPIIRMRQLQSQLDANIDDLNILNDFMRLGYELGEYQLIEFYMRNYLARHPRHNATRQSLAMVLVRKGERVKAKKELRKILGYNPRFHQARELLDRMRKGEI